MCDALGTIECKSRMLSCIQCDFHAYQIVRKPNNNDISPTVCNTVIVVTTACFGILRCPELTSTILFTAMKREK